jgi:nucleoside-diphosphate-sugar epimerase
MSVLVTGASGFVGRAVMARLAGDGHAVRAAVRRPMRDWPGVVEDVIVGDLTPTTRWHDALASVDTVIHLAARVHVMHDAAADPLAEFRRVNVEGTLNLARQAAAAGVSRFVFVSSVKVHGEAGTFTEADLPAPADAYGVSKHEAEEGLRRIAADTGLEVAILRPPLVYGPGVKANFLSMMRIVARGIPLPFGAVRNRRSLIALDNLVDVVLVCAVHPAAANQTFLVSDGEDLSTPDLIRRLARAMGRPARLVPVPMSLLSAGAAIVGRRAVAQRLFESLRVDIAKVRATLGWTPPISVDEGLRRAVGSL